MTRTLPLRKLIVPIANGSDPDVIEMDDCTETYGDNVIDLFPEIDAPCDASPSGQCVYDALSHEYQRCLYCGKRTG